MKLKLPLPGEIWRVPEDRGGPKFRIIRIYVNPSAFAEHVTRVRYFVGNNFDYFDTMSARSFTRYYELKP